MLGTFPTGHTPHVTQMDDGRLAIYAHDKGEMFGFALDMGQAVETAIKLLRTAHESGHRHELLRANKAEIFGGRFAGETFAKLVIAIEGVPIETLLDATQFAELATAISDAAREIDRPDGPPIKDR